MFRYVVSLSQSTKRNYGMNIKYSNDEQKHRYSVVFRKTRAFSIKFGRMALDLPSELNHCRLFSRVDRAHLITSTEIIKRSSLTENKDQIKTIEHRCCCLSLASGKSVANGFFIVNNLMVFSFSSIFRSVRSTLIINRGL